MTDFEKLARAWWHIRAHDRVNLTLETCTMLFRYANYGICASSDVKPPDPRQATLDLRGGTYKPRKITITAG
jgi:hypothetical protein